MGTFDIMSTKQTKLYAALPAMERGRSTFLGRDLKNGKIFVYCSGKSVFLRDIENPAVCDQYFEHQYDVTSAQLSPSGHWMASGDKSGEVRIWGVKNVEHPIRLKIQALSREVKDIDWTGDSKRVVVVGDGAESFGKVFMWDTGASVGEIMNHGKCINSVSLRKKRPFRIVTGGDDQFCNFFKGPPFKFVKSINDHTRFVTCVRFSNNEGNHFATFSTDKTGHLYDSNDGSKIGSFVDGHKGGIYCCAWNSDNTQILTASADKTLKIWDVETRKVVTTLSVSKKPSVDDMQLGCLWHNGWMLGLSLSGAINYFDPKSPDGPTRVVNGHNVQVTALAKTNDGFVSGDKRGRLVRWKDNGDSVIIGGSKPHKNAVVDLYVSTDGNIYSAAKDDRLLVQSSDDVVADVKLGGQPQGMDSNGDGVAVVGTSKCIDVVSQGKLSSSIKTSWKNTCVAFSPDKTTVAIGSDDNKVRIYSLSGNSLKEIHTITGHKNALVSLAFSGDGAHLAAADKHQDIIVYSTSDWSKVMSGWCFHTSLILTMAWAPDNFHLASGSRDQNIIIWNLKQKTNRIVIPRAHIEGVQALYWANSSSILSSGSDGTVKAWDIEF